MKYLFDYKNDKNAGIMLQEVGITVEKLYAYEEGRTVKGEP